MDAFLTALQRYGCADMDITMDRFMQDEEFYYDILQQTMADPGFARLGEELRGTDVQAAFDTAHTLKGILANCGLTPMYTLIVQIVEPLRAGSMDGLEPIYQDLLAQREKFTALLQTVKPEVQ